MTLFVVGVALVMRLLAAHQHIAEGRWMPDENDYIDLAGSLVEHGEFRTNAEATTEIIRGPTYSAFLVPFVLVFGASAWKAALIVQAFLGVAVILLMAAALKRLLLSNERTKALAEPAARIATLLLVVSPFALLYDRVLLSESVATLLLAGALTTWIYDVTANDARPVTPRAVACGVLLGALILAKPAVMFLPLGLTAAEWLAERRRRDRRAQTITLTRGAVVLAVSALIVLPWTYRNYRLTHKLIPVGIGAGAFLWQATLPADGSGVPLLTAQDKSVLASYMAKSTSIEERIALDRSLGADARARIAANPRPYLKNLLFRPAHLWISSHSSMSRTGLPRAVGLAIILFSLATFAAAVLAMFFGPPGSRITLLPLAVVPLYFTLIHLPIQAGGRYTVPAWPAVLCLAAVTISVFYSRRHHAA